MAKIKEQSMDVKPTETWERDSFHFADPVPPLVESLELDHIADATRKGFAEWSLPMEAFHGRVFDGWVYFRMEPFGGEPPPGLAKLMQRFPVVAKAWKLDPRARKRILGFERFISSGGFEDNISTWEDQWEPEARERTARLASVEVASVDDAALAKHLENLRDHMAWVWTFHANIHLTCFYVRGRFAEVCERLFGLPEFEAYELIAGGGESLLGPTAHLARIAARVRTDLDATATVKRASSLDDLADSWVGSEVATFLDEHGHRTLEGFDFLAARLRERPEMVLKLLRDHVESATDPHEEVRDRRRRADERVAEFKASLDDADRAEFEHWLDLGRRAYPLNESHEALLNDMSMALTRDAVLETGRRLAERGVLDASNDVVFLYLGELTTVLRGGTIERGLVAKRRELHERRRHTVPPAFLGTPPAEPPLDAFPPAVAGALRIILGQLAAMGDAAGVTQTTDDDTNALRGIAGSPGTVEGRVRVVLNIDDFARVGRGEILVCPVTTPAWTILFPHIGGLVTDSGGMLSHAAIVAREFGVPAVVGTGTATSRLRDGQIVRVDGSSGEVTVLDAAADSSSVEVATSDEDERTFSILLRSRHAGPSVIRLTDIDTDAAPVVGGKAARLAELVKGGFRVPDAFVITTAAYGDVVAAMDLSEVSGTATTIARTMQERFEQVELPGPLVHEMRRAYDAMGCPAVAVRSSAVAEDLADASFAGQYESILNVEGFDAVIDAVRKCWTSLWNERVTTYRFAKDISSDPAIAVVVQQMAPHDVAGVAFSANPISGSRDEIVINASRGLGEAVVSGEVVPDQWIVRRGDAEVIDFRPATPTGRGCLDDDQLREVSRLATDVESHYNGVPQDIEWSCGEADCYLLQSRPISTLDGEPVRA